MGIQELSIKGFRSLRDVTWRPGALNVVIGPNGSGKSNLLRAIGLLRGAAMGTLSQEVLGMGGIAPLLWDGRTQELALTARVEPFLYDLHLRQLGAGSRYRIEKEWLTREASMPPVLLERVAGRAAIEGRELDSSEARLPDEQTLLSLGASSLSFPKVAAFRDLLSSWTVYHDIRVDPAAPIRQAAVARMEPRVATDGQNLVPVLHPSMLPIVAEHAVEAARRTQVIVTTHSAQLLDAFTSTPPTTTVAQWDAGETRLSVIDGDELAGWREAATPVRSRPPTPRTSPPSRSWTRCPPTTA